ncbi:MAG: lysine--tRNA ligase [Methanomicrobia archaeon]|nr:lysine--tRNA ligase [Methanomicrobia archaeon]
MEKIFWCDKLVDEILEREEKLEEKSDVFITESGLGASGIPHIGSAGDCVRAYMIFLALKDRGLKSKYYAVSDDRDGLRKVPIGFPKNLEESIGHPVSNIDDPFGCHRSYGEHMSSLLMDGMEKIGVEFEFISSDDLYKKGVMDKEIKEILKNHEKAGEIIKRETLQERYTEQYPFFVICENCGKIYTTRITDFHNDKVEYVCDESFLGKNSETGEEIRVKGCGYRGETSIRNGKLQWKVEFAARWKALKINFEAFGKDILDSVKVNDAICREMLNFEPPVHALYELFVEKSGERISKSKGNVFTPQVWLDYGSPESMRLLMLKRLNYTRVVNLFEIPKHMDEVDRLANVYFGEEEISNERERAHLKRLYEYVCLLKPPEEKPLTVSHYTLIDICNVIPKKIKNRYEIIKNILLRTKLLPKDFDESELKKRIEYATNFVEDVGKTKREKTELNSLEKKALSIFKEKLTEDMSAEEIQTLIFETAKENEIKPRDFFKTIYRVILGVDQGPRAGSLIKIIGVERIKEIISEYR